MKKEKQNKDFWKKLWILLKPYHKRIYWFLLIAVITAVAQLAGPYFLKVIIDKIVNFKSSEVSAILVLVALYFFSEQFVSILGYLKNRQIFWLFFAVEAYLHTKAQEKLVYLSLSYHEKENTGNKIIKIGNGIQKILDLIGNMGWEVVPTLIQMVVTIIVLFVVDWRFGVSLLFFIPIFLVLTYRTNKELYPMRKKRFEEYEKAAGIVAQSISNVNTVKSFVQERRESKRYEALREYIKDTGLKEWFTLLKHWLGRDFIVDFGRSVILLLAVYLVSKGTVSFGSLVFAITLSERTYFSLYRLSRFYDRVEEGAIAVSRLTNLLNQKSDIRNPQNGLKAKKIKGSIKFKNVSYTYKDAKDKALDNLDLQVTVGAVTAFIGPSGGGKTTIARMIYRHYDPQEGAILLDGKNLKEYDLYSFRRHIAIVPQEVEMFSTSVRNNIAYAKPNASEEEVVAASKIANSHEFVEKLAEKYNTEVGERGIKLSGGQKQRIGIARAILANPKILIFDEATSNLDSQSEKLIQDAMAKISHNRTMIIIAHRLSTIKKADKIVVLENGRIVEEGSHIELAKMKSGLYNKLLKLQKLGDIE